jgi:ATP-dependent Clp protease ATP-binding subunit ClpA
MRDKFSARQPRAGGRVNSYYFTDDVRMVLRNAREEAARLRHEYVGTEHILLACTTPADGAPARLLEHAGASPRDVRAAIEELIRPGLSVRDVHHDLPYTSRAKKVLEMTMVEARELQHNFVGVEHLLLGMIREEKGIAAQVLAQQGARAEVVRAEMRDQRMPREAMERQSQGELAWAAPEGDDVWTVVRGGEGRRLNRGVVVALSTLWVALWLYLRPDMFNWRLIALLLVIVTPPVLLWRFTRR